MGIDELREEVSEIDRQVVELLYRRMDLAVQINRAKVSAGKPVRDEERVNEVLEDVTDLATELGLDSRAVKEIFEMVIELCEEKQYELRGERSVL
ncbi:MAG: Chorismate mutase [Methanonatronarchaeales archaeon]|nr:Chorismate mutase [Methanonatronarchaeales archaeon]